jgi:hypothetical protein
MSHVRPLIDVLETVANVEYPRPADRRAAPSPRTDLSKRRRARSANGR